MHNTSPERDSSIPSRSTKVSNTSGRVITALTAGSLAAILAIRGCWNDAEHSTSAAPNAAPASDSAPEESEHVTPVAMAQVIETSQTEVQVQPVSLHKRVMEKAPLKPGKPTIAELPEGEIKPGTKIRLRAGNEEGGQEYLLEFDENGQIIIDGKKYEQAAKAYRDLPFIGRKLIKTVPLKWNKVMKIVAEDGSSKLDIVGQPIDKSADAESNVQTESDLVNMAANADSGKLIKPLGKKLDKLSGFEVDAEWTIAPAKQK